MKTLYTARATVNAGRDGLAETDDNMLTVKLGKPGSRTGTNPEQLFACGYGACFGSAVEAVARKKKIDIGQVVVDADVALHEDEDDGFYLSAALNVTIENVDDETAAALIAAAHEVCPYSKATRGNIDVTLSAQGRHAARAA